MTIRSVRPVTGVVRVLVCYMRYVERAKHWTSHSNVKEREKKRTDGPPRLPAIMSRSRKLAAPSSIMPSSYIVMCDQPDLLFLPASSSSSCSSPFQLVPLSCSANGVSRVADSRSRCKLAGKNKRRDLARPT